MKYLNFDTNRPYDLILLGRVAIDLNPAVSEGFKPLKNVSHFEKYVGGSPANIACGVTRHGMKAGFIGKVSDNQENLKICAKLHKSHFFEKVASVENSKCLRFPER